MPRPTPKLVTFEIDGREVSAPEGAMLVDAAKHGDVEIPYFCYEPKLGAPVGACRMCLVEIEGMPKLQTACSTAVKDGMVVNTTPDRVKAAQNAIVEFLLINHPLDCPVCDKGEATPLDIEVMSQVQTNILGNCLCVLGDSMAMPIGSMIEKFRPEFEAHMEGARRKYNVELGDLHPSTLAADRHSGPTPIDLENGRPTARIETV